MASEQMRQCEVDITGPAVQICQAQFGCISVTHIRMTQRATVTLADPHGLIVRDVTEQHRALSTEKTAEGPNARQSSTDIH